MAVLACAGGEDRAGPERSPTCVSGLAIIRGVEAREARFDAVGSVGAKDEMGLFHTLCSGSLIAPDLVLTAKHCAIRGNGEPRLERERMFFAIGPDAGAPLAIVEVAASEISAPPTGGVAELGSDVAVYRLEEAIPGVEPLPIFPGDLPEAALGTELTVVGYGTDVPGCDDAANFRPLRRKGSQVLTAVEGNIFDSIYGGYSAYLEAALLQGSRASAERRYQHGSLFHGYEVWVTSGSDGSQPCRGDSGGPVLLETSHGMEVVGVASWSWRSEDQACDHGSVVAVFGPETRTFLARVLEAR